MNDKFCETLKKEINKTIEEVKKKEEGAHVTYQAVSRLFTILSRLAEPNSNFTLPYTTSCKGCGEANEFVKVAKLLNLDVVADGAVVTIKG
jgi:predicted ATP-dependent protease